MEVFLRYVKSGKSVVGMIELATKEQLLACSDEFRFDWKKEKADVFRVVVADATVGLMSVEDIQSEERFHINLLESSKRNVGREKILEGIAGCLIAKACKDALRKGYGGFVSLQPKTELENYYQSKYGFVKVGRYQAVFGRASIELVKKYFDDEF